VYVRPINYASLKSHSASSTVTVEADQAWGVLSKAVSGQTWGAANQEAKEAVSEPKRKHRVRPPFLKVEPRQEVACQCLIAILTDEPYQPVMWHAADSGPPSFEGSFEANSENLVVLMDAAKDRLRYAPDET